jgi:hypothetical protein
MVTAAFPGFGGVTGDIEAKTNQLDERGFSCTALPDNDVQSRRQVKV